MTDCGEKGKNNTMELTDAENALDKIARCRQTVEQRFQQIVNKQLQSTIPKSIDNTDIRYKTVLYNSSLAPAVKIYLKTITENNENLCRTFCIPIYIPHVYDADDDLMLDYLSEHIRDSIESFLVRLTKGIIANDLTAVADTENNTIRRKK